MSYILEALKKAEQQRELGRVPGIGSDHDPKSADRNKGWFWALVVAVNMVVLAALFLDDREAAGPVEAVTKTPVGVAAPKARAAVAQPIAGSAQTPQPLVAQPGIGQVQTPQPLPLRRPAAPGETASAAAPKASARLADDDSPQQQLPTMASTAPVLLPVWPQVPGHLFEQLSSSLHLDVHVYSEQPRERFVLLNLRKYHEGDELQEGPRLDEITPEGVILSFMGERFRVQRQ